MTTHRQINVEKGIMTASTHGNGTAASTAADHDWTPVRLIDSPCPTHTRLRPEPGQTQFERLRDFWIGQVDLAPVALFRIVYGLLLFSWFWRLRPGLGSFFTDQGMLPRSTLYTLGPARLTLLSLVDQDWAVSLVWLAGLVVAVLLA